VSDDGSGLRQASKSENQKQHFREIFLQISLGALRPIQIVLGESHTDVPAEQPQFSDLLGIADFGPLAAVPRNDTIIATDGIPRLRFAPATIKRFRSATTWAE
jgi:hypothetical protein